MFKIKELLHKYIILTNNKNINTIDLIKFITNKIFYMLKRVPKRFLNFSQTF